MKHRTVDYDVQEVQRGFGAGTFTRKAEPSRDRRIFERGKKRWRPVWKEINNGIERTRRAAARK
jgi:hypothetical protein